MSPPCVWLTRRVLVCGVDLTPFVCVSVQNKFTPNEGQLRTYHQHTHYDSDKNTTTHTKKTKNNLPYIAFSAIAYITKNSLLSKKKQNSTTPKQMWQTKYMKKTREIVHLTPTQKKIPHITTYRQTRTHRVNNFRFDKFFETFFRYYTTYLFLESKTHKSTQFSVESTVFTRSRVSQYHCGS